jgi:hypothetical protein
MPYRFVNPSAKPFSVFVNAPYQIVRHADIECATGLAREDVNPIAHWVLMDCRVKPGNDEEYHTRIGIST